MKNKILKYEIIGFIFTCVVGTLAHFVYKWSGENSIVGLFTPVNESQYEHLKLLFFPYLLYALYENIKLNKDKFNIFFAKLVGIISGILLTLAISYISAGMIGRNIPFINISSFYIGVLVAYIISYMIIKKSIGNGMLNGISLGILIIIGISFIFFTYYPIKIPFFMDQQDYTFGITKQPV